MGGILSGAFMSNPNPPTSQQFHSALEKQLFNTSHFGVLVVDKNRKVLNVNNTFCHIFGYTTPDEVIGQSSLILHLSNNDYRLFGDNAFNKVLTNKPLSIRYQLLKKDRTPIWVQISGVPAPEEIAVIWTIVDITESKQANEKLRESDEKFRITFQTSPDSISLNRLSDGVYVDINEGFTKSTGYRACDVIGKSSLKLNIWKNQTDRKRLVKELQKNGYVENLEAEFLTKNKEVIHGLISARIIVVNNEQQIMSVTRDISDRKNMEEELTKREEQLRQKYKMEAIGVMAGGLAHNFNNALAVILGSLEMAKRKIKQPEKVKGYVETATKASLHSCNLVSQILTYCRQETIKRGTTDLCTAVAETLKLLHVTLPPTITLNYHIPPERKLMVHADPNQIQQALLNLCNNAVQAMEEDGTLNIHLKKVDLQQQEIPAHYKNCSSGQFIQMAVKDTGCGMNKETMERIFDPFFTTKNVGEGTGMGLSTVQGIVDQHGGMIKINSTVGVGTTFYLYFPVLVSESNDEGFKKEKRSPENSQETFSEFNKAV
jgi:PAS domain S-box-containing protein